MVGGDQYFESPTLDMGVRGEQIAEDQARGFERARRAVNGQQEAGPTHH